MAFSWTGNTAPFFVDHETRMVPARFVLAQVGDGTFRLEQPFAYVPAAGAPTTVASQQLGDTDLATVPSFMLWFVSRHGRHTPAALLHDQLLHGCKGASDELVRRAEADRVFLAALDELGVYPVRSRVMWSAVVLATRWHTKPWGRLGIAAWGASALAGSWLLWSGVRSGERGKVAGALLAPSVGALLWGPRQYVAGLVGGYAVPVIAIPAAASFLGYGVYRAAEELVRLGRLLLPANRGTTLEPPISYRYT